MFGSVCWSDDKLCIWIVRSIVSLVDHSVINMNVNWKCLGQSAGVTISCVYGLLGVLFHWLTTL